MLDARSRKSESLFTSFMSSFSFLLLDKFISYSQKAKRFFKTRENEFNICLVRLSVKSNATRLHIDQLDTFIV